jgi:hypothetical protein
MKEDDKKGQFFLIIAVVIIGLMMGLSLFTNSLKAESYTKIKELKEELEIESSYVLDYGVYNEENMNSFLEEFTDNFAKSVGEDIILYFIFGEEGSLEGLKYEEGNKERLSVVESDGKAVVEIENEEYKFDLKFGQNFYYIIYEEVNEEIYIGVS